MAGTEVVDYSQITSMLVISTVLTGISFILIVIRIWVRFFALKKSGLDDYMVIAALIFTIGYVVTVFIANDNRVGHPIELLTFEEMTSLLKLAWSIEIIYSLIMTCVKSSIIFMYDRFAISHTFRRTCIGTNIFMAVLQVIYLMVVINQCQPVEKAWDVTRLKLGSCIDITAYFYFSATMNIVLDAWILIIPIPTVRKLRISKRSRRGLYAIFGVGAFSAICSCARLYSIYTYTETSDPFRHGVLVNLWSMVEINIAIWCACCPALKPVFSRRRFFSSQRTSREISEQNFPENSHPANSKKGTPGPPSESEVVAEQYSNSSSPIESPGNPSDIELGISPQKHC
ncbi:hypothetical protein F5B19DRAFT_490911 [Rostrohypoxylon terebratum]|nr:hypothetical protein F5B19DRAFT_490911 [Rostrohypoxylon terebratum]